MKIKIYKDKLDYKLDISKELVRLFCTDSDLLVGINENKNIKIISGKLLKRNDTVSDIVILTNIGIFFLHLNVWLSSYLNKNEKFISLDHFYYMHHPEQSIDNISKMIGYPKVPKVHTIDGKNTVNKYDELIYGWVSYVKNNKKDFLKYGAALLMFAIEVNDLELIDNIYQKCLKLFKKDLKNNKEILSIITTSMPLLNEYYPEYITRYSSDTNMIIDSLDYKIDNLCTYHLYPFSSNIKIVDLTPSKLWTKFSNMFHSYYSSLKKPKPTITFIIPYIKFSSYPQDINGGGN